MNRRETAMKKFIIITLIASMVLTCGCGKKKTEPEAVDTVSDVQTEETEPASIEETVEESNVQIGNPWVETNTDEIYEKLGFWMLEPQGVSDVKTQMNESEGLAEMLFSCGEPELDYVFRAKKTGEFEDISGLYYDWVVEDETQVGWCKGLCKRAISDTETVDVCLWFDEGTGIMYSLSTSAPDLDGYDIVAVVLQTVMPMEEEYTGFMPSNFLESKLQKDIFDSFDEIISSLDKGNAYAYVKVYGCDEDLLMIAESAYDNGDGKMAAIDGSVYKQDNGTVKNVGNVFSSGTAYPLSLDKEGLIYSGGNHEVNVQCISEETSAIMNKVFAYESFDEDANVTYGGFIRNSNQLFGDETEISETDSTVLPKLYEEYQKTTPIEFTVVK